MKRSGKSRARDRRPAKSPLWAMFEYDGSYYITAGTIKMVKTDEPHAVFVQDRAVRVFSGKTVSAALLRFQIAYPAERVYTTKWALLDCLSRTLEMWPHEQFKTEEEMRDEMEEVRA